MSRRMTFRAEKMTVQMTGQTYRMPIWEKDKPLARNKTVIPYVLRTAELFSEEHPDQFQWFLEICSVLKIA